MRTQVSIGVVLTVFGIADLAGLVPPLVDYAYAIVWWGLLLLLDAWNCNRRGLSLWRFDPAHFLSITLPLSVLAWLFFEALNIPAPQWRYHTEIPGIWRRVLLGFAAFATVIPIMVEFWWLVAGRQCLPAGLLRFFHKHRAVSLLLAAISFVLPFINSIFWFNQGIWLIPALVLLPFLQTKACRAGHFLRALTSSALLAGLAWETLNYSATSHWEYLILPEVPHLFYMPLPGYLGFIPFALSMLAVYQYQRSLKPSALLGASLYTVALAAMYWLTTIDPQTGIWLSR